MKHTRFIQLANPAKTLAILLSRRNFYLSTAHHKLKIGDKASMRKTFTQDEVNKFAEISGDNNPIHINEEYAKTTRFKQRIVHGVLTMGLLSGILGTKLPGQGSVLLSYEVSHRSPLYVGEEVEAEAEVAAIDGRRVTMNMSCQIVDTKKTVLNGSCKLLVTRKRLME